ncbi:MAG: orotate phosphoribosyltransferase [Blastococcus sp.]|jgi:orotate phosphoribosyltransferase|nr:orotate phosphoribosyltransferase [Blastococcus sp.]
MEFRSVGDLANDVVRWCDSLPADIDVVVGIPRSGLLAANLLALHLNVPLADIDGLAAGRVLGGGARLAGGDDVLATARTILVVDDSVATGGSMDEARRKLADSPYAARLKWAAVYVAPAQKDSVDFFCRSLPLPRVFEWNVLHHGQLSTVCMDIDGVLCRDPLDHENDDADRYRTFLSTVQPRLVPGQEVGWLVTSRLERYRAETEEWLRASGIRYGELLMHPAADIRQRQRAGDHAVHKAAAYRRTKAWLFIESDRSQAAEIARLAKRPVYCTDTRTMVYPGGDTTPSTIDRYGITVRRIARGLARRMPRLLPQ